MGRKNTSLYNNNNNKNNYNTNTFNCFSNPNCIYSPPVILNRGLHNLTNINFDNNIIYLLSLNLKFCPTPKPLTDAEILNGFNYFARLVRIKYQFNNCNNNNNNNNNIIIDLKYKLKIHLLNFN